MFLKHSAIDGFQSRNYFINFTILNFSVRILFPEAFLKVKPACILIILQLIILQ